MPKHRRAPARPGLDPVDVSKSRGDHPSRENDIPRQIVEPEQGPAHTIDLKNTFLEIPADCVVRVWQRPFDGVQEVHELRDVLALEFESPVGDVALPRIDADAFEGSGGFRERGEGMVEDAVTFDAVMRLVREREKAVDELQAERSKLASAEAKVLELRDFLKRAHDEIERLRRSEPAPRPGLFSGREDLGFFVRQHVREAFDAAMATYLAGNDQKELIADLRRRLAIAHKDIDNWQGAHTRLTERIVELERFKGLAQAILPASGGVA